MMILRWALLLLIITPFYAQAATPFSEGDIRYLKSLARGGVTTGWPSTLSSSASTSESANQSISIRGQGGQASNGADLYQGSDGKFYWVCVVASVRNACDYIRKLASGKKWEVTNSSDTAIFTVSESTGAITNATIDCTLASNACKLQDERHYAVATCQNVTASTNFDVPTANSPAATCDTGSNTQKGYLAFDATTDESFEDHWILPTGFVSVNVHFRWKAAATSGAVGWCAQLIRVADGSTSDPAYPAQAAGNCVSDTAKGTTLQENVATITSATCTSCAAGDHVYVRISRDANGGAVTDDMTGDALLLMYGRTFVVNH